MEGFYRRLDSSSPAEALAAARRELKTMSVAQALRWCEDNGASARAKSLLKRLRNVGGEDSLAFPAPYYWAPFVLFGEGK